MPGKYFGAGGGGGGSMMRQHDWNNQDSWIHTSFLPSLFRWAEPLPEELKELVSLSPVQGGTGIPDLKRESLEQFNTALI